jgi:hypothetical protein
VSAARLILAVVASWLLATSAHAIGHATFKVDSAYVATLSVPGRGCTISDRTKIYSQATICVTAPCTPPVEPACVGERCGSLALDAPAVSESELVVRLVADGNLLTCLEGGATQQMEIDVEFDKNAQPKGEAHPRPKLRGDSLRIPALLGLATRCNDEPCKSPLIVEAKGDAKTMKVTLSGSALTTLVIPVRDCTFEYSTLAGGLVAGATYQAGTLFPSDASACSTALISTMSTPVGAAIAPNKVGEEDRVRLQSASTQIDGNLSGNQLELFSLPTDLGVSDHSFDLYRQGSLIGKVRARSIGGFATNIDNIEVRYDDADLDSLHDHLSKDGVAVVKPPSVMPVTNETPVTPPPGIRAIGEWEECYPKKTEPGDSVEKQRPPGEAPVRHEERGNDPALETVTLRLGANRLPSAINYVVKHRKHRPLLAAICLREKRTGPHEDPTRETLRVVLTVAAQASEQSLPLPIRRLVDVSVTCGIPTADHDNAAGDGKAPAGDEDTSITLGAGPIPI